MIGLLGLCWGSFLNVVGHRLLYGPDSLTVRSHCPNCKRVLQWYDLIPLISWIKLGGRSRCCHRSISILYPFIELYTSVVMMLLYLYIPSHYWPAYFILFSALLIATRTDLQSMLISRYTSLYLIPVGIMACALQLVPVTLAGGIIGACIGYGVLWGVNALSVALTGNQGIGQGDYELLAQIGSFTGVSGAWISLCIGAALGSCVALIAMTWWGFKRNARLPFGPFLAFGAIVWVIGTQFPWFSHMLSII